jgi:hypothetical protein
MDLDLSKKDPRVEKGKGNKSKTLTKTATCYDFKKNGSNVFFLVHVFILTRLFGQSGGQAKEQMSQKFHLQLMEYIVVLLSPNIQQNQKIRSTIHTNLKHLH